MARPPIATPFSIDLSIQILLPMMFDTECGADAIVPKIAAIAA
jgi:hypothetical protein